MVATRLMTAAQFAAIEDEAAHELIEGEIETMSPAGRIHSLIASRINKELVKYCLVNSAFDVLVGESGITLGRNPDTVLVPDLAIASLEQIETVESETTTFSQVAPLIVIEVKSPTDSESRIAQKLSIYLQGGVGEVWWVRPDSRSVTIHRPTESPRFVDLDGTLTSSLLPDFSVPLKSLFRGL